MKETLKIHCTNDFRYDFALTNARQLKLEVLQSGNTNEWNFVCITRDSSSGKTDLFLHGKRSVTANKLIFPGKTLKKGGKITLAGAIRQSNGAVPPNQNLPLTISQVNVWDRKLTSDEITAMYGRQKCDGGAGNILDWEDFKNELVLSKFTKADQSQCTSMPESTF
jgi:hypothetical protein